ncbi:hypothetical protein HYH03_014239 [Edaphochlamys debaryana]|uniref:Uncharacterized protein n=1 Tax=Edaphochlamys debaryana TaxID=47281 RepID=A0A835XNH1_9CHLO|nr:hypothetical protein HYH03_014239 [Edaphochlamys debaryana]|eukprot:KAG2487126.1 hypothetical protein HYH03_014239 [Edaphochlamys debaryana]
MLLDAVAADHSCPYLRQISIPTLLSAAAPPMAAPGAAPLPSPLPYSQQQLLYRPHHLYDGFAQGCAQYSGAECDGGQPSAGQSSASHSGRGGAASSFGGYAAAPAAGGVCMLSNPASPTIGDTSRRPSASSSLPGHPASTLGGSFSDAQCPNAGPQLSLNLNREHRAPWLMASFRRLAAAVRARGDNSKGPEITLAASVASGLPAHPPLQGAVAPWTVAVGQSARAAC